MRLSKMLTCSSLVGLVLAGTTVAAQAQEAPPVHATQSAAADGQRAVVNPSPVEFGRVRDRRTVSQRVFVMNPGPDPLFIGNVSISEDIDFSGGGGSCQFTVLAAREGCVTTVFFTPTGSGDRTATLYIMSQDGLSTWASVRLHGIARR